jgi:hypothetical protein
MSYFRNLESETQNSFHFAEDLGHATDRAQGVLGLVAEALGEDEDNTLFFAVHSVLKELHDMRDSIDTFLDSHPDLATNGTEDDEVKEDAE